MNNSTRFRFFKSTLFAACLLLATSSLKAQHEISVTTNARPATIAAPGSETVAAETLTVSTYPNPFIDRISFRINSKISGIATLEIFDTNGRRLAVPFHGQVKSNVPQTVEYVVNGGISQRNPIVYKIIIGPVGVVGQVIRFH